jgi:8-oxo-dGTP pyrophosphatase MutT (NUDIX family)
MYIKIYFNDRPLFLCDTVNDELESYVSRDEPILVNKFSPQIIPAMVQDMRSDEIKAGFLFHYDLEESKNAVWKNFHIVKAAGGIVINENQEMLFILRLGKWDLPKGKLDSGETIEECATREVEEETGLKNVQIKSFLLTTYHTYKERGKFILKETYWYTMKINGDQKLVPQTEEDILDLKWVRKEGLGEILKNTYPSIKDVLAKARMR